MKVLESQIKDHVVKTCTLTNGELHLFNSIAIIEFSEGANISLENTTDLFHIILDYFGTEKPFGLISNRVHSYALQPLDMARVKEHITNLSAYGVIATDSAGRMGAEIENSFCKTHNIHFNSLYEAADVVYQRVKEAENLELN